MSFWILLPPAAFPFLREKRRIYSAEDLHDYFGVSLEIPAIADC